MLRSTDSGRGGAARRLRGWICAIGYVAILPARPIRRHGVSATQCLPVRAAERCPEFHGVYTLFAACYQRL